MPMKKSFTLIELIIVIAIIGILSAVGVMSLNFMKARARDSIRKQDFKEITTALWAYYGVHGAFPIVPGWDNDGDDSDKWAMLVGALVPNFMTSVPQAPLFNGSYPWYGNAYHYTSDGVTWLLVTKNETLGFDNQCPPLDGWCCGYWSIRCSR
ncbi:MAG: prepilin-type N-terminal cleavage/methylation domain-containing protein [bacterium]